MSAVPHRDTLLTFLRELKSGGKPAVRLIGPGRMDGCLSRIESEAAADPRIGRLLRDWHLEAAEDLSGPSLPFDEAAARWGAAILFRAAWFYLNRDAPAAEAAALLNVPMPVAVSAASLFSADLTLRWLPDIHRMALALAPGDPLLGHLQFLANSHPLSCASLPPAEDSARQTSPAAWMAMRQHAGLWRLFIDRVIASGARWWLPNDDVRPAVREAAGAFARDLIPALDLSDPEPLSHEPSHS